MGLLLRGRFLVFFVLVHAVSPAWAQQDWVCPLRAERPVEINPYHAYMEPIEFFIQSPEATCPAWVKKLERARELLLKFGDATLYPPPTNVSVETKAAAGELATLLSSLILDTQELVRGGKLCNGKTLNESSYTAAIHLVRALYATHDQVLKTARIVDGSLRLSKSVPEAYKALQTAVAEQKAFQEERFLKRACEFLKSEYQRKCASPQPTSVGSAPKPAPVPSESDKKKAAQIWEGSHSRMRSQLELVRGQFGDKTLFEHLLIPLKLKKPPTAYRWNQQSSVENAYYEVVAPTLRLCGLFQALQEYERPASLKALFNPKIDYAEACRPFFCKSFGLFSHPDQKNADAEKASFCEYVAGYRDQEKQYLNGFLDAAREKRKEVNFCPSVSRLPPVDGDRGH